MKCTVIIENSKPTYGTKKFISWCEFSSNFLSVNFDWNGGKKLIITQSLFTKISKTKTQQEEFILKKNATHEQENCLQLNSLIFFIDLSKGIGKLLFQRTSTWLLLLHSVDLSWQILVPHMWKPPPPKIFVARKTMSYTIYNFHCNNKLFW